MLHSCVRVAIAIGLCFLLTAAAQESADRRRSEMLVTTDWLATHLHDSDLIVLCIAENDQFYSAGHIPGARLVRLSEIVTPRDGIPNQLPPPDRLQKAFEKTGVTNGSRVILYGERSGVLAARAYFTLDYLGGAARSALLDGSIEKWRAEQRPESTDMPPVALGNLTIHLRPEIVVDTPRMAEYSHEMPGSAKVALLDARPLSEYSGERLSENVAHAGHIPNAHSLFWKELLTDGEVPQLRSEKELRSLFENAGAQTDREVITYCRTGMQSSFDYFVAKYLGYSARMYTGSFYEWSRSTRSVEKSAANQ